MTKQERAKKILLESGWIEDYYYVLKVMESCLKTTDVSRANVQLSKAFSWGKIQLENKLYVLRDRNPKYKFFILDESTDYVNFIWDIRYKIQDKINYGTV